MKTDWTKISTDELLNWDGAQTDQIARYDRIMRHRETVKLQDVGNALIDLKSAMHKSTNRLENSIGNAANMQRRAQWFTIGLTVVIAFATLTYAWSTWQSVQVQRDANAIQRELLESQLTETLHPPIDQQG